MASARSPRSLRSPRSPRSSGNRNPPRWAKQFGCYTVVKPPVDGMKGANGSVHMAIDRRHPPADHDADDLRQYGQVSAIKVMNVPSKTEFPQERKVKIQDIRREVFVLKTLSRLNHENIVAFIDVQEDRRSRDNGRWFCIALECAEFGSLKTFLDTFRCYVNEKIKASFLMGILSGLECMHENGFIHRDIKPGNVLLSRECVVKLADFGSAARIGIDDCTNPKFVLGTPVYMAPEMILLQTNTTAVDIWSVGATAISMIKKKGPWPGIHPNEAVYQVGNGAIPEIPKNASDAFKDFMALCFIRNPSERPSATQLKQHRFLEQVASQQQNDEEVSDEKDMDDSDEKEEQERIVDALRGLFEFDTSGEGVRPVRVMNYVEHRVNIKLQRDELLWKLMAIFGEEVIGELANGDIVYHLRFKQW